MARPVSDSEVAAYFPLCQSLARQLHGRGGAEYDDLFQEGCVAVFDALRHGFIPSKVVVSGRMRNWVRYCRKRGFSDEFDETDPELLD